MKLKKVTDKSNQDPVPNSYRVTDQSGNKYFSEGIDKVHGIGATQTSHTSTQNHSNKYIDETNSLKDTLNKLLDTNRKHR